MSSNPRRLTDKPDGPASPARQWPWWAAWAVLALIVGLAGGMRIWTLGSTSFWLDELYSQASSTGHYPDQSPLREDVLMLRPPNVTSLEQAKPWWTIWSNMRGGEKHDATHPPLYIVILRLWREAFGQAEIASRSLSVVSSLGAMVLLFLLGKELLGTAGGLWAAAMMGAAWVQIEYAREARPYALMMLEGVGAMLALVRIERLGPSAWRLVSLGLCVLAMALTHYFTFGAIVALMVYILVRLRGRSRFACSGVIVAAGLVFLVTWGPSMWAQRHNTEFEFLHEPAKGHFESSMVRLDQIPQRFIADLPPDPSDRWDERYGMRGLGVLAYVVPLVLLLLPAMIRRKELLLPYLWMVCTIALVLSLDLSRTTSHLRNVRYVLLAAPGFYLIVAGLLPARLQSAGHLLCAVLVLTSCALEPPGLETWVRHGDWRFFGQVVHNHVGARDPLVFAMHDKTWMPAALYMGLTQYEYQESRPVALLTRPADPELLTELGTYDRIYLVGFPAETAQEYLPGWKVEEEWDANQAYVYRLSKGK